jgi:hypothetical protein
VRPEGLGKIKKIIVSEIGAPSHRLINAGCCVLADKSCDAATGSAGGSSKKPAKSKRVRTIFTPEQLERLEAEFKRQQYMVGPERLYLAHTLQLTEAQVHSRASRQLDSSLFVRVT